ncbi:AAA family ATPase [Candidatus Saccharibacteria bacterium]|nr:AAA family ATPase [Candidatus Saccharibacteria bacterium]
MPEIAEEKVRYYFGGANGSGKSTLVSRIVKQKQEFIPFKGATELMEALGIPGDYDKLRAMDHSVTTAAFGKLVQEQSKKHRNLIIDAHYMNLKHGKFYPVWGDWLSSVDALVLVEAPASAILERIELDPSKDRALFPAGATEKQKLSLLKALISTSKDVFLDCANQYNKKSLIIENTDPTKALDKFIKFDFNLPKT